MIGTNKNIDPRLIGRGFFLKAKVKIQKLKLPRVSGKYT